MVAGVSAYAPPELCTIDGDTTWIRADTRDEAYAAFERLTGIGRDEAGAPVAEHLAERWMRASDPDFCAWRNESGERWPKIWKPCAADAPGAALYWRFPE